MDTEMQDLVRVQNWGGGTFVVRDNHKSKDRPFVEWLTRDGWVKGKQGGTPPTFGKECRITFGYKSVMVESPVPFIPYDYNLVVRADV